MSVVAARLQPSCLQSQPRRLRLQPRQLHICMYMYRLQAVQYNTGVLVRGEVLRYKVC